MEHRNRSSGWQYAKLSGHKNEDRVKCLLDTSEAFRQHFLDRVHRSTASILETSVGGLHEKSVPGVNGRKTKSKTDLQVYLDTGEVLRVSIKKSGGGQVYFVKAEGFIRTYERQFGTGIPAEVQRAIRLFWAGAEDAVSIIQAYADPADAATFALQLKHKSLNATTLTAYDPALSQALLRWFQENADKVTRLAFSMGAARDSADWSDYIWHINLLEENQLDKLFSINALCRAAQNAAEESTFFSTKNGGTTIQLPFGFVQWHQRQLQFHHSYDKLCSLCR